ncbi:MAG TPA: hypothetical protein PKY81_00010 [bacterium]|nr:hypothetical protein [bacterium]HPN29316.1 hypothetical protein [bacterium]
MSNLKKLLNIILYILTIAFLAFACLILSKIYFSEDLFHHKNNKPFHRFKPDIENMINNIHIDLIESLDLSKSQMDSLDKIKSEIINEIKNRPFQFEETKKNFINELSKNEIDTSAIINEMRKVEDFKKNDFEFLVNKFAEFHKQLSASQRKKLIKRIEESGFPEPARFKRNAVK